MPRAQEILGQKFGKLTVLSATDEKDNDGRTLYECQCDCGGERTAPAYLLLGGRVTSCGCARKGHIRSQEVESERVKQIYNGGYSAAFPALRIVLKKPFDSQCCCSRRRPCPRHQLKGGSIAR